jgi:hypothetical protein
MDFEIGGSTDLYVQITAISKQSDSTRTVVVFVPGQSISDSGKQASHREFDAQTIARKLANPIARNVFTHRASFGSFRLAYLISTAPPLEIEGKPPEFVQAGLKAWII